MIEGRFELLYRLRTDSPVVKNSILNQNIVLFSNNLINNLKKHKLVVCKLEVQNITNVSKISALCVVISYNYKAQKYFYHNSVKTYH